MKKLPLGIQSFREIIEGGYVYVDKTNYIHSLLENPKYYFLSRHRRFGKSLLLDTITEAFSGDKELFKGLWIYTSGYSFPKHPAIRIDMSRASSDIPENLEESLLAFVLRCSRDEGITLSGTIPSLLFVNLIEELHKKYSQK